MRLLWSFVFALAKANLTIKLTQGGTKTSVTSLTLDDGKLKADDKVVGANDILNFESTEGIVEEVIFGRLRMVSFSY